MEQPCPVVFYDARCGFCQAAVGGLRRMDRAGALRFAPLEGRWARQVLRSGEREQNTLWFVWGARRYCRSGAVLQALAVLGWPWRVVLVLLLLPAPFRDGVYRLVARWRYRLRG